MPPLRKAMPVPLSRATFDDTFWAPRMETNRKVTVPVIYEQCKRTGRIGAWRLDWKEGRPNRPHIFWDSDVAKWLEAAAYVIAGGPDRRVESLAEGVANLVAGAQQADGYLNSYFTAVEPGGRWRNLRDEHELYCAGHLVEAAVAYHAATGRRRLLDAVCGYADLIGRTFGRGRGLRRGYPGHPELELALVRLHGATGRRRYLDLARFFVDERGREPHYFDLEAEARGEDPARHWAMGRGPAYDYYQAHAPVREQRTAEGHAVRALYLYSGTADVAAETDDRSLLEACRRLWRNVTERRMYITGGVGSGRHGERFTFDYDLPNETAYAETCAAIALVFFAHRMLGLDPDARYADVMERALYNGVLSGVSLDGRRFFYENPLAVYPESTRYHGMNHGTGGVERLEWFGCACCPPNVARVLASLPGYAYSESRSTAFVHLYAAGCAELELDGRLVGLTVRTRYPWDGKVRLTVEPERPLRFTLALRVPGWCTGPLLRVNGEAVAPAGVVRKGYARLLRRWERGDRVELSLPMPVRRIEANPRVRMDCGRVALQRGPLVYCLEEVDNGPQLSGISLPRGARLKGEHRPDLLGGVTVVTGAARRLAASGWGTELYRPARRSGRAVRMTAVPYYAWCNRRPGEMLVWVREG
jgi:DUF1680 family protein